MKRKKKFKNMGRREARNYIRIAIRNAVLVVVAVISLFFL